MQAVVIKQNVIGTRLMTTGNKNEINVVKL